MPRDMPMRVRTLSLFATRAFCAALRHRHFMPIILLLTVFAIFLASPAAQSAFAPFATAAASVRLHFRRRRCGVRQAVAPHARTLAVANIFAKITGSRMILCSCPTYAALPMLKDAASFTMPAPDCSPDLYAASACHEH